MFFWLAFHNSIPTLLTLHYRGISPTTICRNCQGSEEFLLHCIRDCPPVRKIWEKLGFSNTNFYQISDVHAWLKQGATGPNDKLFIACVWWSWKARNAKCFNNEVIPLPRLLLSILNLTEIMKICFKPMNADTYTTRQISWYQENRQGIILNVDGSSLGNPRRAGFGGLFRNPDGGWISGFSGFIGHSEVLKVELLGIYHGLRLAWERDFKEILCYTDSLCALKLIKEQHEEFHRYATIVQDNRDSMALPWKVELLHTLREGNQCTDYFAKLGANSDDKLRIFTHPPPGLRLCLVGDAAGTSFPWGYPSVTAAF